MKRQWINLVAAVLFASAAVPQALLAQERPVTVSAGAVIVSPMSGTARQFNSGLGGDIGVTWHIGEQLGIRFDYVQATLGAKSNPQFAASVPVFAKPRMQFGTANVVFQAPVQKVRLYVTGGVGLYHRSVALTVASPGPISICNPWWFVCFPAQVTSGQASATRSTSDLGVNVGAGLATARFFAEMRYHYIWGPTFNTSEGPIPATGKFLPLIVGVRF